MSTYLSEGETKPKLRIAFDVDGTLITEDYTDAVPRYDVIQLFWWFHAQGHTMFIWSGGGMDYARRWMEKLGLDAVILEKKSGQDIDIAVDDCECDLAVTNLFV